jgi:hypothetical protein
LSVSVSGSAPDATARCQISSVPSFQNPSTPDGKQHDHPRLRIAEVRPRVWRLALDQHERAPIRHHSLVANLERELAFQDVVRFICCMMNVESRSKTGWQRVFGKREGAASLFSTRHHGDGPP